MGKWVVGLVVWAMGWTGAGKAQSLADDIKQLTLDYEKLAQEKQILTDMYTGYALVKQGYEQIKGVAEGNFHLHQNFLAALLAVSPAVRSYYNVSPIINSEAELVRQYQSAQQYFSAGGTYTSGELVYFNNLYAVLLSASLTNLDELAMVMTDGDLRMSDAERLAAVDRIDKEMSDRFMKKRQIEISQWQIVDVVYSSNKFLEVAKGDFPILYGADSVTAADARLHFRDVLFVLLDEEVLILGNTKKFGLDCGGAEGLATQDIPVINFAGFELKCFNRGILPPCFFCTALNSPASWKPLRRINEYFDRDFSAFSVVGNTEIDRRAAGTVAAVPANDGTDIE